MRQDRSYQASQPRALLIGVARSNNALSVKVMNIERPTIRSNLLLSFVLLYGAASFFHYSHNAEFLGDYPNMPAWLSPALVYGAWLGVTVMGLTGYFLILRGYHIAGLAVLGVYGALGLDGLGHYTLAPLSAHTFAMNMSIWLEAVTGALLLATVCTVMLRRWRT